MSLIVSKVSSLFGVKSSLVGGGERLLHFMYTEFTNVPDEDRVSRRPSDESVGEEEEEETEMTETSAELTTVLFDEEEAIARKLEFSLYTPEVISCRIFSNTFPWHASGQHQQPSVLPASSVMSFRSTLFLLIYRSYFATAFSLLHFRVTW